MSSEISHIIVSLNLLHQKVDNMQEEVSRQRKDIDSIKEVCEKMKNHIGFIENTYSTLHKPINYMKQMIESVMPKEIDK